MIDPLFLKTKNGKKLISYIWEIFRWSNISLSVFCNCN